MQLVVGATNLVTGLADAMIDSNPIVCITGQVYASLLGTDAFQETDVLILPHGYKMELSGLQMLPEIPEL